MPAALPPAIETVIVRSARLPASPSDAAFSVTRIDSRQLAAQDRLDEALTAVPGVSLFRRTSSEGANPTTQGVSLREIAPSGAGRALVTLDGAPQNDPFGGWVIWSALPPEAIDAVDLVRGGGAGPYGAGALTGVVALQSLEGSALRAEGSAGGRGQRRAAVAQAGRAGDLDILASATAEHSDGWTPVRRGRGAADRPLALHTASAALRVQGDAGAGVLAARVGAYTESRESGLAGAQSRARGVNASLTLTRAGAEAGGWRLQGWAHASDLRNRSVAVAPDRSSTTPANDQYETPAVGYGLNAAWRGEGGRWELGGDLRGAEGQSRERFRYMAGAFTRDRAAGGRTLVAGLYAEIVRRSGPWLLTGGTRADYWSSGDGHRTERDLASGAVTLASRSGDRSGWAPTARAGLRRELGSGWLRTAAYAGFRPPTLNELHRPFRVGNDITEANPALEPEKLYGLEVGAGAAGTWGDWSLTLFHNRLHDPVTNVTIGQGPGTFALAGFVPAGGVLRQRRNAGRIDATGIEGEIRRQIGPLGLRAAATYTEAEVDGGAAARQLTGLRPAQAPRLSAAFTADWQATGRLTLRLEVRHEGARFEDDLNSRRLGAATTGDARASFALTATATVFAAVDNLGDAAVATGQTADGVYAYGPPRTLRVGVSLRR